MTNRDHQRGRPAILWALASMLLALSPAALLARAPVPVLRLPLEPLDYQSLPAPVIESGAAILTLDYVDAAHLLVTFSRRRLLMRIPDDPATDVDRNIDAVLVELPSGKSLARTSWRMHDPGPYLWPLGSGHFLLRQRNLLTTISPLANLAKDEAFRERPFLKVNRAVAAVSLSPEKDLLTLETTARSPYLPKPRKPSPGTRAAAAAAAAGESSSAEPEDLVQIDLFRIRSSDVDGSPRPSRAGVVRAHQLLRLPIDAAGYLSMVDQGRAHWAFDFHRHNGKVDELSPFDSTCTPVPYLVSRSEFVAFGCRGGQDPHAIGAFNLRGEEMWEQSLADSFTNVSFAYAPTAGRFAMSRLTLSIPSTTEESALSGAVTGQTVTVFQTETGRQVFSLTCAPVMRAAQNFALSPAGDAIAVINNGAIEIYPLPPLSAKEKAAVQLAESLIPERTEGGIRMGGPSMVEAVAHDVDTGEAAAAAQTEDKIAGGGPVPPESTAATKTVSTLPQAQKASTSPAAAETTPPPTAQLGDAPAETSSPRKPPTLYQPGEQHDSAGATTSPR